MFYGIYHLPWWGYLLVVGIVTQITIFAVTLYLHRCQAHRGLTMHPILSHFFRFWLWMTTGMETKAWTSIHRKHHAKCETDADPHSPQVMGLAKVLWQGAELYRLEAANEETQARYGHGTPNDWIERHIYTGRSALGIKLMLGLNLILFGVPGIAIWAVQMAWIPFFAAGVVNGLGHFWGYRNYECDDASTNLTPWGLFIGGEELHNNHHTYPSSAKFSLKWWEFDIGWMLICVFRSIGLMKVKRVAPKPKLIAHKHTIDVETVKALINTRFQVMSSYTKYVVLPTFKQELNKLQNQETLRWTRIKRALIKEAPPNTLETVVENNQVLRQVCQYREQLHAIWNQTSASQKELLEALHTWCAQAEASGLQALKDFSNYLKSYGLKEPLAS
jgi:stearoyl-CoA desaturase (delta-9 desaturase)